jgi:hypothetical protein
VIGGSASCSNATQAASVFGRPVHTYHVAGYAILVWRENLLTRLG